MEYIKTLEIISIILVAITFIVIWIDYSMDIPYIKRLRIKLNFKPFNCMWCLSFWVGLLLACVTFDIIYLSLPLITKITYR